MLGELGSCIEAVNQRIDDRLGFHLIAHHMRNEQDHQLGAASIGGVVPEQVADHGHVLEQWDAAVSDTATLSDQAAERHREAVAPARREPYRSSGRKRSLPPAPTWFSWPNPAAFSASIWDQNRSFWQALLFNLHDAACRNCRNGAGFKIQFREECRFDPGHPHHHSVLPLKVETTRSGRARCAVSHRDGPKLWRLAVSLPRRRIIHLRWTSQSSHPAHGAGSACGSPENAYSYWLSRQSKL